MARAYSQDLRDRVIDAIVWVRRARQTGARGARKQGQPKRCKLDPIAISCWRSRAYGGRDPETQESADSATIIVVHARMGVLLCARRSLIQQEERSLKRNRASGTLAPLKEFYVAKNVIARLDWPGCGPRHTSSGGRPVNLAATPI
jgi:hypothetical protein